MNRLVLAFCLLFACPQALIAAENLVANGGFETDADGDGAPDGWATSGHPDVKQVLATDTGHDGGRSAKLTCTAFTGSSGWHHVMLCQVGVVGVKKGAWYRVRFRAKSEGKAARSVSVALSNTRTWKSTGLWQAFGPGREWQAFEFLFNAESTVPAKDSRLQIWFGGVGTLWLDDVAFEKADLTRTWHPTIAAEGVTNAIPNSSFECGSAGWGGCSLARGPWGANLYRLVGSVDHAAAAHGSNSLRIHLDEKSLPRLYFDYYDPYADPVRSVLAANRGWIRVEKGKRYVLSASMRAAKAGTVGCLGIVPAEGWRQTRAVTVGADWQRVAFAFRAPSDYVHVIAGLDLQASKMADATLWLDALQLEVGSKPTDYGPRRALETCISVPGEAITAPAERGIDVHLNAYNADTSAATVRGTLTVTDGFDREVARRAVSFDVPAGRRIERVEAGLAAGRRGFLRVTWRPAVGLPQTLRLAVIEPAADADSRFGMNHAFPQQFLIASAKRAGVLWHRDWSVKWQTVQPTKGAFDFTVPDTQINRVLDAGARVLLLFPFPSSVWASTADPKKVASEARGNAYLAKRLPTAFAARDLDDFARYVRESVRHYRNSITHYQVLNEPLYTTYALPQRFGYQMADYLAHLRAVHEVAKREQPGCVIVGGLGGSPADRRARAFIEAGGLKFVDVLDIHIYAAPSQFDWLEDALRDLRALMKKRGEVRPMWITEFGLYADDDPATVPPRIGDTTMARCGRKSELAASSDLVKLTTMFAAHGVEKVFFHAGTAPAINQPNAGNVFFEYGGAPRTMYAAAAVLARLLPPGSTLVEADTLGAGIKSYTFKTPRGQVTVAWAPRSPADVAAPAGVTILDLMGNPVTERNVRLSSVPVYLVNHGARGGR